MRHGSKAVLLATLLCAMPAFAATHYLTVINDSPSTVTSVSYAPPDTNRWFVMEGAPLEGGRAGQATIAMPPSSCVFDFRIRFKDQPTITIKAWNACRESVLHVGKAAQQASLEPPAR
jgi:hypothetical protein